MFPDPSAYWQSAFDDHGPAVLAFLRSRRARREEVDDLLQETFVRAIRAQPSLSEPARLRSYLLTVAHNLLISQWRRNRIVPLQTGSEESDRALEHAVDGREPSDARARFQELRQRIGDVRDDLTPGLRTAFDLAILEQASYDEIARRTGWSPGQVRINVFRARHKAMEALRDLLPRNEERTQ